MTKTCNTSYKGTTADCSLCDGKGSYVEDFCTGRPTVQVCTRCHNVDGLALVSLAHLVTQGQLDSIARLIVELEELGDTEIAGLVTARIANYDFAMAAKCVAKLQLRKAQLVADKRAAAPTVIPTGRYPEVPAGRYATPSRTGNNDLDFWNVQVPTKGKWANYRFVKRIIGGHEDTDVRGAESRQALQAIVNYGIEAAGMLYATETTNCRKCNIHLTDDESRARGYGPTCWGKVS